MGASQGGRGGNYKRNPQTKNGLGIKEADESKGNGRQNISRRGNVARKVHVVLVHMYHAGDIKVMVIHITL